MATLFLRKKIAKTFAAHSTLASVSSDFLLNLAAVLLSTGAMQLLLYPQMALKLGSADYGEVLTVIGVVNVVTLSLGNNLANSRLVRQGVYDDSGETGDFQALLAFASFVSALIVSLYCYFAGMMLFDAAAVLVFTLTTVLKSYYLVAFRIVIDYKKNLIANTFLCVGYVVGAFFFLGVVSWPWAFTVANIACIAYILKSSRIAFEPCRITKCFHDSLKSYGFLVGGGLLGNVSSYLDRFIINPILGAASVSAYTVATFFPKGLGLALSPLTGVLLSYFARGRIRLNKRRFLAINAAIFIFCAFILLCSATLGCWITQLFYPTIYEEAEPYIAFAAIGVALNIANSYNGTVVLVVSPPIWQTIIPAAALAVYFALALILAPSLGLWGICYASIVSNGLRFLVNLILGLRAFSPRYVSGGHGSLS